MRKGAHAIAMAVAMAVPAGAQDALRFREVVGGAPERGRDLIGDYACGVCHAIPGIQGARGSVGPDLSRFGSRDLIAGIVPNRPDLLVLWLQSPPALAPDTGMPDMGVTREEAEDMAAYLATLRGEDPSVWSRTLDMGRTLLGGPE